MLLMSAAGMIVLAVLLAGQRQLHGAPKGEAAFNGQTIDYAEAQLDRIALRYAPIIFQEVDRGGVTVEPRGREDFIAAVDFDGDLQANNNWENQQRYPLLPVVYYSLVETGTHLFVSYSIYHPRDWSRWPGPYVQHENDMENVQVVIAKAGRRNKGTVLLLLTQRHVKTAFAASEDSGVKVKNKVSLSSDPLILLNRKGKASSKGTHVGIFIERKGHGIYSLGDREKVRLETKKGKVTQIEKRRTGTRIWEAFPIVQYVPTDDPSRRREPAMDITKRMDQIIEYRVPYTLESVYHRFWLEIEKGNLCGNGKLFDGHFDYKDSLFDIERVPRRFDSDMRSGPGKSDAGITPFAIGISLTDRRLGVFSFNPALGYKSFFQFPGPWSDHYLHNPYLRSPLNRRTRESEKHQAEDDYADY